VGDSISAIATAAGLVTSPGDATVKAANQANATQMSMFDTTQQNMAPYLQQGLQYQNQLASQMPGLTQQYGYSQYLNSPEYMNAMQTAQTGQQNMLAQGAATGMLGSGNMASGLQSNALNTAQQGYSQGLSDYWGQNQNVYNMLSPLSAAGQNAAAGLGGMSQQSANALSNNTMAGGAAQTASQQNTLNTLSTAGNQVGNQIMGAIGNANQNNLYQQYLQILQQQNQ